MPLGANLSLNSLLVELFNGRPRGERDLLPCFTATASSQRAADGTPTRCVAVELELAPVGRPRPALFPVARVCAHLNLNSKVNVHVLPGLPAALTHTTVRLAGTPRKAIFHDKSQCVPQGLLRQDHSVTPLGDKTSLRDWRRGSDPRSPALLKAAVTFTSLHTWIPTNLWSQVRQLVGCQTYHAVPHTKGVSWRDKMPNCHERFPSCLVSGVSRCNKRSSSSVQTVLTKRSGSECRDRARSPPIVLASTSNTPSNKRSTRNKCITNSEHPQPCQCQPHLPLVHPLHFVSRRTLPQLPCERFQLGQDNGHPAHLAHNFPHLLMLHPPLDYP